MQWTLRFPPFELLNIIENVFKRFDEICFGKLKGLSYNNK